MSGGWKDRLSVGYGTGISSLDQEIDISSGYRMGEAKNGVARAGGKKKGKSFGKITYIYTQTHDEAMVSTILLPVCPVHFARSKCM